MAARRPGQHDPVPRINQRRPRPDGRNVRGRAAAPTSRDAAMRGVSRLWETVQRGKAFWDVLEDRERRTLQRFFTETKGDPRRMARHPKRDRDEVIRIVRDALRRL